MEVSTLPDERTEISEQSSEVVLDVTDIRFRKVVSSRSEYSVERVSAGRFIVRKGASVYFVGFEKSRTHAIFASCNCPDWNFHARTLMVPCKHIWLVAEAEGAVSFPSIEQLPPAQDGADTGGDENKKGDGVPLKDGKTASRAHKAR